MTKSTQWGHLTGARFVTSHGRKLTLRRHRNRTRFYDLQGRQVGPKQPHVCGAIAYMLHSGWGMVTS